MLAERVRALGIDVRRESDVTSIEPHDDGVHVAWQSSDGAHAVTCHWLVGCDGGRSSIRKMAGFAFPGTEPTSTMYHAMVTIDHPERLLPFGWQRTPRGVFAYGPFPGRLFMLDFSGVPPDRDAPVTCAELDTLLQHISGKEVRVTAVTVANRWTDNTRLIDTYRRGRVLLAGDAAHIHSPFGGQGLSLGLADAANLGWKLAAVVRGDAPATLLDTYGAERRPVAEAVLANTLAQLAILRPDPQSGAMRDLLARLMVDDGANRIIGEAMSGLDTRYDTGSEHDAAGRLIGDRPVRYQDAPAMLYDLMQDGSGVLLAATDAVLAHGGASIRCATIDTGPSLLIRPDGCVAWAGDDTVGLLTALDRLSRSSKPSITVNRSNMSKPEKPANCFGSN
jgi:flavin-dependent dehydrogenase